MPKFQSVKEVKISESVSNIYAVTHVYERSQIANGETLESLVINSTTELGRKGGGLDITWEESPDKGKLKENLLEDMKRKIKNNGGKNSFFGTIYFKDGYMDTTIVGEDLRSLNINSENGKVSLLLKHYCPKTVGSGDVSQVNFNKEHLMSMDLPVRYFESYEKSIEFIEMLKEDSGGDGKKINIETNKKDFNENEEGFKVEIFQKIDSLKFAILDMRSNISYPDHYGPFMFNTSLEIPKAPRACIVVEGDCTRGSECTLKSKEDAESVKWSSEGIEIKNKNKRSITFEVSKDKEFEVKLTIGSDQTSLTLPLSGEETKNEYGSCS